MKYILFSLFLISYTGNRLIKATTKKSNVSVAMTMPYSKRQYKKLKAIEGDSLEVKVIKLNEK